MRPPRSTASLAFLLAALGACAAGSRIVATGDHTLCSPYQVARALADADVVALGELHHTPDVHATHLKLIEELHLRRPDMVIAMEMFERSDQTALLEYLNGFLDDAEFEKRTEVWSGYDTDYRPLLQWARDHGVLVLGANAPRDLVKKARKEGVDAVAGEKGVAREIEVPEGAEYDDFVASMEGHPGVTEQQLRGYYLSQCVWNATMAETITDHLQAARERAGRPLVVLVCGKQHSDHWRGAVGAIKRRMADLDVRVVSSEAVADLRGGSYETGKDAADYVIVVARSKSDEQPTAETMEETPEAGAAAGAGEAKPELPSGHPPVSGGEPRSGDGLRPALGFMPGDYSGGSADGILVGPLSPGGGAEKAGIEEGDLIVALNGVPTPDMDAYLEALGMLTVGKAATVRVRRGEAEVDLQVVVGSRSR